MLEYGSIRTMVQAMYSSTELDGAVMDVVGVTMQIGGIIMIVAIALRIGWHLIQHQLKKFENEQAQGLPYTEIARIVFMVILFVSLTVWITPLAEGINFLAGLVQPSEENQKKLVQWQTNMWMDAKADVNENAANGLSKQGVAFILQNQGQFKPNAVTTAEYLDNNVYENVNLKSMSLETSFENFDEKQRQLINRMKGESEYDQQNILQKIGTILGNIGEHVLATLGMAIARLIKSFMLCLVRLMWSLTIIVAPLAIAFSIGWPSLFSHWFKIFMNAGFSLITLRIIMQLDYAWTWGLMDYQSVDPGGVGFNTMFSFLLAAMYMMVYRITSWYVGKAEVGQLAQKGVQIGGIAAGAMLGAGMMKMGGGMGGQGKGMMNAMKNAAGKAQSGGSKSKQIFDDM